MSHPLLALAAAYDHAVPPLPGRPSLKDRIEPWVDSAMPGDAIGHYAAHFSVLTQACQLGDHGVLEEPQTDALYGLLATSFWHARVLDDAYFESQEATYTNEEETDTEEVNDVEVPYTRYWLHQRKPQEAMSGFDFGIITSCHNDRVKVTLFQAKRPAHAGRPLKLSLDHMVRQANGVPMHDFEDWWKQLSAAVGAELNQAKKQDNVQRVRRAEVKRQNVADIYKHWETYARPQSEAISTICTVLDEGGTVENVLTVIDDSDEIAEHITRTGKKSLFTRPYSYRQCDAFLVTAIRGWRMEKAKIPQDGWCHYVQWVNRSAGEPWSVRLEKAFTLRENAQDGGARRRFADVLGASLSPIDETVGLVIDRRELSLLTGAIMSDLPGLVWAAAAERPEIARDLLRQCGVPEAEIVPDISQPYPRAVARVKQPDNDLGNINPKPDRFDRSR